MFRNYLITAIRNLGRHKVFSLINIAGLSIGISAALVIYLMVHYELGFEKFHKDGDRIYRVVTNMHFPDQDFKNAGVPGPLPAVFKQEVTGVEKSTLFYDMDVLKVTIPTAQGEGNVFKKQEEIIYTTDDYFRFFDYEWLQGSAGTILGSPGQVVLTESRAKLYFPFAQPSQVVGQRIIYDDTVQAVVTGIVKDLDEVTDFRFKEFVSLSTFSESLKRNNGWDSWGSVSSRSQFFIKLKDGTEPAQIDEALAVLRKKHEGPNNFLATDHFVQPLHDIHFNADFNAFDHRQGHRPTLYGLLAVAAFLLLLGCINFVNLTTAQASQRSKEIGIRKTMGSSRKQLVFQFFGETFMMTLVATIISIVLAPSIMRLFSEFLPEGLRFNLIDQPHIIIFLVSLVLLITLLSGFYPALLLSGFKPVTVMKNVAHSKTGQSRRAFLRKTLTVSQFVIAQFLIIATLVVAKQIRYSLNKDLGFKKDAIINFNSPFDETNMGGKQAVLMEKLKAIPGLQKISLSGAAPASTSISISTMEFQNQDKKIETSAEVIMADSAYVNLYNIKILAGRNLHQSDTTKEYLINETYARLLGFKNPEEAVGKSFTRGDGGAFPIVGVFADVHTKSMHTAIQPLVLKCALQGHTNFHIALPDNDGSTDQWKSSIAAIGNAWKEVFPEEEFKYSFFDESIEKFYKKEQQTASLLNWATGLAIFISCLGLLGLVMYTTTQRTREIGVRKVLGASVGQIVSLLSKDFIRLVIVAIIIATPIAWWAMNKWLEDFAYRTSIGAWVFVAGGLLMLLIALVALSIQTIRSAIANPVDALRTE